MEPIVGQVYKDQKGQMHYYRGKPENCKRSFERALYLYDCTSLFLGDIIEELKKYPGGDDLFKIRFNDDSHSESYHSVYFTFSSSETDSEFLARYQREQDEYSQFMYMWKNFGEAIAIKEEEKKKTQAEKNLANQLEAAKKLLKANGIKSL